MSQPHDSEMTTSESAIVHATDGTPIQITVVDDIALACPGCGAYWGHPDPALSFPNRFKVEDYCKCYNPACEVEYYDPYTGQTG